MQVLLNDFEIMALLKFKAMINQASTPIPQFLNWVADRLVKKNGDDEQVDFVQTLRQRGSQIHEISMLLGIDRGPERMS